MKKIITRFVALCMLLCTIVPALSAAVIVEPVPASRTAPANPEKETVASAVREFKGLNRRERKARIKEAKKVWKAYRKDKKAGRDTDAELVLLVILAILLPPLAVLLKEGDVTIKFWISLLLSLLVIILWPLWLIAVAYALLVVFDQL